MAIVNHSVPTQTEVVDICMQLLPRGQAWTTEDGGWSQLFLGLAPEFVRLQERIEGLLTESDPRSCSETLDRWEADYGLPDECSQGITSSVERRNLLTGRVTQLGNQSAARFIGIANDLGYAMTITTYSPGETIPGHPEIAAADAAYVMQFNLPADSVVSQFFASDGVVDDPLDSYATPERVVCEIERVLHAHIIPIYTLGLI